MTLLKTISAVFALAAAASASNLPHTGKLSRTVHSTKISGNPNEPTQPTSMIISVVNIGPTNQTLSTQDMNLWEGTWSVSPPTVNYPESTGKFKYAFQVSADPTSQRINGTVLYNSPECFLDFFSVVGEWGLAISHPTIDSLAIYEFDAGGTAVYTVVINSTAA